MAYDILTRGIHNGLCVFQGCLVQGLRIPVIPIAHLVKFFVEDEVCGLPAWAREYI